MKHKVIRWNPHTQEWYCLACGRTSDHTHEPDAHVEMEQYDCKVPWAEMPSASMDNPGSR